MLIWVMDVLVVLLASGLGYVGGRLALARHGRRDVAEAPPGAGEAAFTLAHLDQNTWSLTNTGTASARVVTVVPLADGVEQWPPKPPPGSLTSATSELLPTLAPGGSLNLWLSRNDRGQQVLVAWTSESNVRMGPVVLDVPAPGV